METKKEEFLKKTEDIGAYLNLKPEPVTWNYNAIYLMGENNIKIFIRETRHGIIEISGIYPRTKKGELLVTHNIKKPLISASLKRNAIDIARDIQRRFMPLYLQALEQVVMRNKEYDDYTDKKVNNIKKIAEHFGFDYNENRALTRLQSVYCVESYNEKNVKFEVITTPEIAIKIIELLKGGEQDENLKIAVK